MARKFVAVLVFLSSLTFLLAAACTGGGTSSGGGSQAQAEKTVTIAQYADPTTLDPQDTNDNAAYSVQKLMIEGLVGFNEKMNVIPQLAEKWDASPDAKVFTFYLRKGVKFHDGTPFNAAAVKDNFDRVRNADNKLKRYTLFSVIKTIDVVDDSTVRFTLSEPFGAMIATFAHPAGGVSSPAATQKFGLKDYSKNPVGTGPYKFVEWAPSDHITMVKNPDYWDKANGPQVDKIIVKPVPEAGTRIAMLQKGDAQFVNNLPPAQAQAVKDDKNLAMIETEGIYCYWIALNTQKKPFDNVKVRQALNYAIDKEAIVKNVFKGFGRVADSPIAPGVWGYSKVMTYPYDPAKAKSLLAEAGYPNGFKATMRAAETTENKEAMVAFQAQLAQVGVQVEVQSLDSATMTAERYKPLPDNKNEMEFAGTSPSTGDADWGIRPFLTKANWPPVNFNVAFYTNQKVEDQITAALTTADPEKRKVAYAEAQKIIMDDAPWVFLWSETRLSGSRANVSGITIQPDNIGFYRTVTLK